MKALLHSFASFAEVLKLNLLGWLMLLVLLFFSVAMSGCSPAGEAPFKPADQVENLPAYYPYNLL